MTQPAICVCYDCLVAEGLPAVMHIEVIHVEQLIYSVLLREKMEVTSPLLNGC